MTNPAKFERSLLGLIGVALLATVVIYMWDTMFFSQTFAAEDGLVEYATAIFLLLASLILVSNVPGLLKRAKILAGLLTVFYALLFFGAAGEEVSWGQRIFGWESGEFFKENNKQFETNLHNMIIPTPFGDIHLAKTVFGSLLTVIILLYLAVLPLLYPRIAGIKRLCDRMAVPVPGIRHGVLAIAASLVIAAIDVSRKWEVYELVFSLLACSIFLRPQNQAAIS